MKPDFFRRLFHYLSNVRPIVWISVYLLNIPLFAIFYWMLPAGEFRIPEAGGTDFWSWLYYSTVTLTTLGFGDYTPMLPGAQVITAIEVLCGLTTIGFFLNAVGAMKSEIIIESEYEKQKLTHERTERERLRRNVPVALHTLNAFLAYCYALTTPYSSRSAGADREYNPAFTFADMGDLYKPSHLPADHTSRAAVDGFLRSLSATSLYLDSLQQKVDMALFPGLLENCFAFVANAQMFSASDDIREIREEEPRSRIARMIKEQATVPQESDLTVTPELAPYLELYHIVKENAALARRIETLLTTLATPATAA